MYYFISGKKNKGRVASSKFMVNRNTFTVQMHSGKYSDNILLSLNFIELCLKILVNRGTLHSKPSFENIK